VAYSLHARSGEVPPNSDFVSDARGWKGVSDVYHASRRLFRWGGCVAAATLVLLYHFILPLGKLLPQSSFESLLAWYLLGAATLLSLQTKPHLALVEGMSKLYLTRFLGARRNCWLALASLPCCCLADSSSKMAMVVFAASLLQYAGAKYPRGAGGGRPPFTERSLGGRAGAKIFQSGDTDGNFGISAAFCSHRFKCPSLGFLLGPEVVPGFFLAQRIGQLLNQAVMQLVFAANAAFHPGTGKSGPCGGRKPDAKDDLPRYNPGIPGERGILWGSPLLVELWVGQDRYIGSSVLLVIARRLLPDELHCGLGAVRVRGRFESIWFGPPLLSALLNVLLVWLLVPRFSTDWRGRGEFDRRLKHQLLVRGLERILRLRELKAAACIP